MILNSIPFLFALIGLILVIKSAMRWPIYLYGRNSRLDNGSFEYLFAIQNGEGVPLEHPFALELEICQAGATFHAEPFNYSQDHRAESRRAIDVAGKPAKPGDSRADEDRLSDPRVYVGGAWKLTRIELNEQRTRLLLESHGLPPLDTWVIHATTTANPTNVTLRFRPTRPRAELGELKISGANWPWYLRPSFLRQNVGDESSLPLKTPGTLLLLGTVLLVTSLYLVPVLCHEISWLPMVHHFSEFDPKVDWLFLLALTSFTLVVFRTLRLEPFPVIQGYQEPTPVRQMPRAAQHPAGQGSSLTAR
ncbi:MAG: hypothetical protein EPO68_12845 [Planctomycetota bacterium]|nr:MAG: hypothetical protein EPO68_12845 [Planctomycetota bacterium]